MRAVRFEGSDKGVVLSSAQAEPECPPGYAIVRPLRVGIGASDRAIASSSNGHPAITLGHEFVGVVESATGLKGRAGEARSLVGKRVVGAITVVCGSCDMCSGGLSNHCRHSKALGISGIDGCFADAFALPIANLHAVPDSVDDDAAVFAEPLASAVQAMHHVRIEGKPYITILGDGTVGLLCAQLFSKLNASVRLIGRHESKLAIAEKWGIKHRPASDVGRRADQDVVVDCTGSSGGLELALRLVRPRGTVVLKSRAMPREQSPCIDVRPIAEHEIQLVGSRCGPIPEALRLLERGEIDVTSLVTRRSTLDRAVEALRIASDPASIKVLLDV